ncbi:hypothetical protein [Bacillus piscicola]|uniref:hypothetical protein n=1 Tax=Bacillus piscicola TaxID=1632684 RepID=UPI001F09812D|nr:hypothetical protein [Bacillus piscicola]
MGEYDVRKESKRSYRNINILFFMVLLLLLIVVVFLNVFIGTITWKSFYMDMITSLIGVMIPLVLFNLAYDHFTKSHQKLEMSDTIANAFMLNKNVLARFSVASRKNFIRNSTESLLGEDEGKMLYTTLIEPYLENRYNFRRNFKYNVCYSNGNDRVYQVGPYLMEFTGSDYYWVEEDLSFFRNMNIFQLKKRRITVGFSYWEDELEELFKGEGVFFRENLFISDEHKEAIQQFTNEELKNFVTEVLTFTFELNDKPLTYEVENSTNGFYLQFQIDSSIETSADKEYKFKYKFQMPQLKTMKKFISIISEPTYNVDVLFTHDDKNIRIVPIPFFDASEVISHLPNNIVKIELDKWVLPRSGCVFIWDDNSQNIKVEKVEEHHYIG